MNKTPWERRRKHVNAAMLQVDITIVLVNPEPNALFNPLC
jgi:hypothetical protein